MTRLLVLTTSWPRHAEDPAGAFVAELSAALRPHGLRSTVVALPAPPGGALAALQRGRLVALAQASAEMARAARAAGPADAVLSHWLLPSVAIGARLGLPQIGVAHGGDIRLIRRLPFAAPWLRARLSGLIAVTDAAAALLRVPRTLVTPMGVHTAAFGPPRPLPSGPLRLLFLSRLVPIKGLPVLLRAVAGLPHVHLTVAGEGPLARLGRTAPPNVTFLGPVPMSARASLLAEHHVVCVPSVGEEGVPRVVLEAWAAGRWALVSDIGGLADRVPAAWRVPAGDVVAWRAAIQRLAGRAQALAAPPSAHPWDWSAVAARVAHFLRECIRGATIPVRPPLNIPAWASVNTGATGPVGGDGGTKS